jgi:hypothetical protein
MSVSVSGRVEASGGGGAATRSPLSTAVRHPSHREEERCSKRGKRKEEVALTSRARAS